MTLVLFDIDATLITTSRVGIEAMHRAGLELHGPAFNGRTVDYAGRLDPLIITDLLNAHRLAVTPDAIDAFRDGYRRHLTELVAPAGIAKTCPGVPELLAALEAVQGLTLGLLTGNFPETGTIKLNAAGIETARFHLHVWGCDSPHDPPSRDHLPAVAFDRYQARHGRAVDPNNVVVIGDTPHDIACARAHGCRAIGVATGLYSTDDLAHADLAVPTLSQTEDLVRWITTPTHAARPTR